MNHVLGRVKRHIITSLFFTILVCGFSFLQIITFETNAKAWTQSDIPVYKSTIGGFTANSAFNGPREIAMDSHGNIYVADGNGARVQKFDSYGNFILKFGSYGTGDGQFLDTAAVTVDSLDNIYVSDFRGNRIEKFNSNGQFLMKFGSYGTGVGQLYYPQGLATDSSNNIYVSEYGNHRIQKFDPSGNSLQIFGGSGNADGQLRYPYSIKVDGSGNLFVADYGHNQVQKFNSSGNFLLKFGSVGSADGQFVSGPMAVEIDSDGNIYTTDYGNHRIQKFNSSGIFLSKFGMFGSGNGQLNNPRNLILNDRGNLLITEFGNNRVQEFTTSGTYIRQFGSPLKTANGYFGQIYGGVINTVNGNLYAADTGNSRVQVFDSDGSFLFKFGSPGNDDGQFSTPYGPYRMVFDPDGNLYVTECSNNRVQKFSPNGTFIFKFGSTGTGDGNFNCAMGIAIDSHRNIYITDVNNNRVQKFDASGNFISKFGSSGTGDGQFNRPYGIAISNDDTLYIVEYSNHRVQKFSSDGVYISKWGSNGSGDGQFSAPADIKIGQDGYLYTVEAGNNRVQKFDSNGNFIYKFGITGNNSGQFLNSVGILLDSSDNIFVTESSNARIQKFMPDREAPHHTFPGFTNNSISSINPSVSVNVSDELSAVTSAQYQLETTSGSWQPCSPLDGALDELSESITCQLSGLTEGQHTIYIRSTDSFTNTSSTGNYGQYTFTVDTTKPSINITDIGMIDNVPNLPLLSYTFTSTSPIIKGITQAGSTIYFVTGSETFTALTNSLGAYTINITNLPLGFNELTYYSKDPAGNQSSSKVLQLTIPSTSNTPGNESPDTSTDNEEPFPIPSDNQPPSNEITVYDYTVVDQNGNILKDLAVYIDGKKYETDSKGKIYMNNKPDSKMNVEIHIGNKRIKGSVLGERLIVNSSEEKIKRLVSQNNNKSIFILISVLVVLTFTIFYLYRRKVSLNK